MSKTQKTTELPQYRYAGDGLDDFMSLHTGLDCSVPPEFDEIVDGEPLYHPSRSMTQQQFKDQSDINTIVKMYIRTGESPDDSWLDGEGTNLLGFSGDYHSMLNSLMAADDAFMALPANIRSRFDNDPAKLLQFVSDDVNYDEAVALGLAKDSRPPAPAPQNSAVGSEEDTAPAGAYGSSKKRSKGANHDGGAGD